MVWCSVVWCVVVWKRRARAHTHTQCCTSCHPPSHQVTLAVHLALAHQWTPAAWWAAIYAVPLAMQTEAILHANNVRDISRDRKAGVTTLAVLLGAKGNAAFYTILILGSYAGLAFLALEHGPQLLVALLASPLAAGLLRSYSRGNLQLLPQETAQHNLVFGVLLTLGLVRWF